MLDPLNKLKNTFKASDWYWSGPLGIYSSAAHTLVPETNPAYVAWLAVNKAPNPWPLDATGEKTAAALDEVLTAYNLPVSGLAVATKDELIAYAAQKRWQVETGGITIGGVKIDTSRESQTMIANAFNYVIKSGSSNIVYKSNSGWVTMDADPIKATALAVGAHVQACFASEKAVYDAINAGTITTKAEIDSYAWVA